MMGIFDEPLPCQICAGNDPTRHSQCVNACENLVTWYSLNAKDSFTRTVKAHKNIAHDDDGVSH